MWKSRAAGTVALLTLPLGLAACGGSSSTASSSSITQSSSSTTSSSAQTPSTTPTTSSPSPSSSSASSSADNTGKPSKKDASAGLSKILMVTKTGSKITSAQADKVASCVVDRAYDQLTPKTLKAMATGDSKSDPDDADAPVFTAAVAYCAKAEGIPTSSSTTS